MSWRYIAARLNGDGTETFLDYEVPLGAPRIREDLSGPGGLTGTISPEVARLKRGGRPLFELWSTVIYAEADGIIRGGGILVDLPENGPELGVTCVGFSGYASGMPYTAEKSWIGVDPLEVVRHIWDHLQAHAQGNLGLTIDGAASPVRVGTPDSPALIRAKDAEQRALQKSQAAAKAHQDAKAEAFRRIVLAFRAAGVKYNTGRIYDQPNAPGGAGASTRNLWRESDGDWGVAYPEGPTLKWDGKKWVNKGALAYNEISAYLAANKAIAPAKAKADAAAKAYADAKRAVSDLKDEEAKPYRLAWFQTFDLGKQIDDLAAATPFDYRVSHAWDGETVRHWLALGYPRLGRRREDLRFVVGENIFTPPPLTYSGDGYADGVLILGAGEGRAMVRGHAHRPGTRLRRVAVIEDKTLRGPVAARNRAESEVKYRLGEADLDTLIVTDHPNAPLGSYTVGDDIFVGTADGWTDRTDLWVRILSMITDPITNTVTLEVTRTDKVT